MTETVYLGIGSNVQPERHVGIAIERLAAQFGTLRLSPLYWSPSVGFTGHDFINAVAAVETTMAPLAVRDWLRALEDEHGRQRDVPKFSDRVLDVDILLFGQRIRTEQPLIDPKQFDENSFVDFEGDSCIIPPNSFALAHTVEYFRIPRNVLTVCLGKSTYARCGIIVNVTPLEPEWEGHVTLEFSNTTPLPARIYANEGVAQFLFFESDEVCGTSYKDRGGKYQGQTGVTLPRT